MSDVLELLASDRRLLSTDRAQRPAIDRDTWDYIEFSSWEAEVWRLLRPIVNKAVKDEFLAGPPEYVVGDDLSWLDDIVARVRGRDVDTKDFLARKLTQRYSALRAVHGTRTDNAEPFYREGLKPLEPEVFHEEARRIFLSGEFPELTDENLSAAIETVGSNLREGRVFFEANEAMLVDRCGHYMLYGSEYLTAIAAHLNGSRDYRQILKRRGTPTLFVCDVPMTLISWDTVLDFAGTAIAKVFEKHLCSEDFDSEIHHGAGFSISAPLSPACIIGHCHPAVRRDPFLGHR